MVLAVVAFALSRVAAVRPLARRLSVEVAPHAPAMASVVALVATAGSLYLSEIADFDPCRLCWYQRAAMYPIGPLVGFALWRRARWPYVVAVALALAGSVVAAYHVALERYPSLDGGLCDPDNPCSLVWVRHFGYLTIPGMALSGFALVLVLLTVAHFQRPGRTAA